jgi:hypothetical protein
MTNGKHWEDHIDSLIREANGGYIDNGLNRARWEICWMKIVRCPFDVPQELFPVDRKEFTEDDQSPG